MADTKSKPSFPNTIKELLAENIGATINFCKENTSREIIVDVRNDYLVTCATTAFGDATTDYRYTRIDSLERFKICPKGEPGVVYD